MVEVTLINGSTQVFGSYLRNNAVVYRENDWVIVETDSIRTMFPRDAIMRVTDYRNVTVEENNNER